MGINEDLRKEFETLANTTTADVDAITQSEIFAKKIIQEAGLGRKLAGVISAVMEDIAKGSGDTVKVRIFPKLPVAKVAEGAENEANAYKPFASAVTIERWNTTVPLTGQSIFVASVDLKAQVVKALSEGWAEAMDKEIATKLDLGAVSGTHYTPAYSVDLASAGDLSDLYAKIKAVADHMRFNLGRSPDTLLITAEGHTQLLTDYEDATKRYAIEVGADGGITKVYGMKVIVVPGVSFDTTLDAVGALVVDSSMAVAEASGMKAKFEENRNARADIWEEVFNAYWGAEIITADLDGDGTAEAIGIGQVKNPSA